MVDSACKRAVSASVDGDGAVSAGTTTTRLSSRFKVTLFVVDAVGVVVVDVDVDDDVDRDDDDDFDSIMALNNFMNESLSICL